MPTVPLWREPDCIEVVKDHLKVLATTVHGVEESEVEEFLEEQFPPVSEVSRDWESGRWVLESFDEAVGTLKGLELVEDEAPELVPILSDRSYVFEGDRELPFSRLESAGLTVKLVNPGLDVQRSVFLFSGSALNMGNDLFSASVMVHEALHLGLLLDPSTFFPDRSRSELREVVRVGGRREEDLVLGRQEELGFLDKSRFLHTIDQVNDCFRSVRRERTSDGLLVGRLLNQHRAMYGFAACELGRDFDPELTPPISEVVKI